jgi:hypothetical protein
LLLLVANHPNPNLKIIHLADLVQAAGQGRALVAAQVLQVVAVPIMDILFIKALAAGVIISIETATRHMYQAAIAANTNPTKQHMKPYYRDQLILGLIIAGLIALWRLVVWLIP